MEVLYQSTVPVTVSSGIEGMMELSVSIGEELHHYLLLWAYTAVKFLMQTTLSISSVYISVSSIIDRMLSHATIINIYTLLAAVDNSPQLELLVAGQPYLNNSVIGLSEIFESNQSLVCATTRRPCCKSLEIGEWYYPNMTMVPNIDSQAGSSFYVSREDDGTIILHLRNITTSLSNVSQFCCELPNINNLNQKLCVYLGTLYCLK
jgi:hypothetical protein